MAALPSDFGALGRMTAQRLLDKAEASRRLAKKILDTDGPTAVYFALIDGARAMTDLSQRSFNDA